MKVILLCYHKNVNIIYPKEWIDKFRESVLNQTYKEFTVYECNYGGGMERIFDNSEYESKKLPTFVDAMNHLIDKALLDGADVVANSNADDYFSLDRMEVQLNYMAKGFDIVSSNFCLVQDDLIIKSHDFASLNIKEQLNKNHNILGHPSIMYSRNFLLKNRYVPNEIPLEDLLLWQRTIDNFKFKIVPENLLFHRIHSNSVCQSGNR